MPAAVPSPAVSGARPWRQRPLARVVLFYWETLLTARGRYLLLATLAFAVVGVDTTRTQVYRLFACSVGLLFSASLFRLTQRPRLEVECAFPERATAGTPLPLRVRVRSAEGARVRGALRVFLRPPWLGPGRLEIAPSDHFLDLQDPSADVVFNLTFERRGRYELRGPGVARLDPLALVCATPVYAHGRTLFVHPRFERLDAFDVPSGRRYQPGGIPLGSSTGDAIEFVGTRDYRAGDPLKHVHWRSWARRGAPVVKEFQEEYFCRIALVLDTFLPRRSDAGSRLGFEAALSTAASIADVFSRREYVVDVLAAGPDLYEVSAGRSLAYLENVLDVLACLEPCHAPPFESVGPALFDRLAQTTTVVAVLLDWDDTRAAFLRQLRRQGVAIKALIVRAGPTTRPWQGETDDLDLSWIDAQALSGALRRG